MITCIICDKKNEAKSIEHIVSESLGNERYVMERGKICDECNNRFSKFEAKALSNTIFAMERARLGVKTKKGKNVKGKINELTIIGDEEFREQYITVEGLNKDNFTDYNPITKTGKLRVKSFDKSEVATSRFLLMMGIESLFTSQKGIFEKYDFTELKEYLTNKTNTDWGFMTAKNEQGKFKSIPTFFIKHYLKTKKIELKFFEKSENELLFNFKFGGVSMIINLLNRGIDWMSDYKEKEKQSYIYPSHLEKRYQKTKEKNENSL